MSHSAWLTTPVSERAQGEQFAYVRGYILALEDILGDLEQNTPEKLPNTAASESHAFIEGWTWNLGHVHDHVSLTLTQARATLAALEQMEQNHIDHVQRPEEQ